MADYQLPAWVNKDPAAQINQAIQSSRARRDQEQSTQFELNRQTDQDEMQRQQFEMQKQAAARKLIALHKFATGMQAIPDTDPQAPQKKQGLLVQYGAESGEFTPGLAAMYRDAAAPKTVKPDVLERVPTGQTPGFPPTPDPTNPAAPGTGSATGVRNPNTGAIIFPEPLNRKLTPPGQQRDYAGELAEKKREYDLSHPQDSGETGPNVTTIDGIKFYKRGQNWTQITGQGESRVDPQLNSLLREQDDAWKGTNALGIRLLFP
jgi:hypothetical protein